MKKKQEELVGRIETKIKTSEGEEKILKDETKYLPTDVIEGPPAYVQVKAGATCNLGSFNSARFDISLSYPCERDRVDEVFGKVKDWVDKHVSEEYNELLEVAKKGN